MSLRNPGCPFCGMPPLDGEPCCTREFQRETMRKADRELADLRAYRDRTEAALVEMSDKLRLGQQIGVPKNPCDIFEALLKMHDLWREPKEKSDG